MAFGTPKHPRLFRSAILIVEERREIIENQIKQQLFDWRADVRSRVVGKFDDAHSDAAPGTVIRHRDHVDAVMLTLCAIPGTTAIVFEQTCAAALCRRRKAGNSVDPDKRLFINPAVCEGCGDCSTQSNGIAIKPLETAFGRKWQINQSACNKDFSCVIGFCPAFVTINGAKLA